MSEKWPIKKWSGNDGKQFFMVEDDQGYNFSFDTMDDAVWYRNACGQYKETISNKLKAMVQRFKEQVLS